METTETKSQAYHRLMEEGRWEEASAYRVEQQRAFRKIGKSPDEARALSWVDTIAHFPPTEETLEAIRRKEEEKAAKLTAKEKAAEEKQISQRDSCFVDAAHELDGDPDDPESISGAERDEMVARTAGNDVDFAGDLLWAYHNIYKRSVRPNDAPSQGAWAQLTYSRKDPKKFMETVNRVLGQQVANERKNRQDDSMDQYEMLRKFKEGIGMSDEEEEENRKSHQSHLDKRQRQPAV